MRWSSTRRWSSWCGDRFADARGRRLRAPIARVHVAEARGFVAASDERYDLIQVALLDSFSASSAGLYALAENYLYTVEALQDASAAPAARRPARDHALGHAAAARCAQALRRRRAWRWSDRASPIPASQLALMRSWKTSTLLVKNGAFGRAGHRGDQGLLPSRAPSTSPSIPACGRRRRTATTWSKVPTCSTARRRCSVRAATNSSSDYKFHIAPATDDKPHFFHFFKWRSLPELLSLKEQGGLPLLEWGYPVLVATLAAGGCSRACC